MAVWLSAPHSKIFKSTWAPSVSQSRLISSATRLSSGASEVVRVKRNVSGGSPFFLAGNSQALVVALFCQPARLRMLVGEVVAALSVVMIESLVVRSKVEKGKGPVRGWP